MKADAPFVCIPSTYASAVAAGCNLVQAKAKGEPCRVHVAGGKGRILGYDSAVRLTLDVENPALDCVLYGAFFAKDRFPSTFVLLIDCFIVDDVDVSHLSYRDRFAHLRDQVSKTSHPMFKLVSNYPIEQAAGLWDKLDLTYSNGLVFRRSSDTVETDLLVARKYPEIPGGLP
jgi:hypothetical protein